jgi:cyclic pyranopterin monophosphate synthase
MSSDSQPLSHLDDAGNAHMVNIGEKPVTSRRAIAQGWITMAPSTLEMLINDEIEKGDAIAVARIAGIQGAKETARAIPLCHPLALTHVSIDISPLPSENRVVITSTCETSGKTGVEMEALHSATVAALSLYDMLKGIDKRMVLSGFRVVSKEGGTSGASYQDPLQGAP